ncbi:hypothetical protein IAD21_03797 [Abditibacteriota bacterium]|nr:hypothetical protein IAD21_03797 [Abditibacteriota bacterium]
MNLLKTILVRGIIHSLLLWQYGQEEWLLVGYRSGRIERHSLVGTAEMTVFDLGLGSVDDFCPFKNSPLIMVFCHEGHGILDPLTGSFDAFPSQPNVSFYVAALNGQDSSLLLASEGGLWRMSLLDRKPIEIEPVEEFSIRSIEFHPDGHHCCIASSFDPEGSALLFYDFQDDLKLERGIKFSDNGINSFVFNQTGDSYALAIDKLYVFDYETHECIHAVYEDGAFVTHGKEQKSSQSSLVGNIVFSREGDVFFTNSSRNILRVNLYQKKIVSSVSPHSRAISGVAATKSGVVISCGVERLLPDGVGTDRWESSIKVWRTDI